MGKLHNWRYKGERPTGANFLISGEREGFAIDATVEGGLVTVRDTTTPSNNKNNVPFANSNLTNGGTSAKMVQWNSTPYLRWSPHNLTLYSEDLSSWTNHQHTSSALANGVWTITAIDGVYKHNVYKNGSLTSTGNFIYTTTYEIGLTGTHNYFYFNICSTSSGNWVGVVFDKTSNTVTDSGNGGTYTLIGTSVTTISANVVRVAITWTTTATEGVTVGIGLAPSSDVTFDVWGDTGTFNGTGAETIKFYKVWTNRGYSTVPYMITTSATRFGVPQEYDQVEGKFGILVEAANTNLVLYSQEFGFNGTGGWANGTATASNNAITAPDGSLTADLIDENEQTVQSADITISAATTYTASVYVKRNNCDWVRVRGNSSGGQFRAWFNIPQNHIGTISASGTATVLGAEIKSVGDGWYRIAVTGTLPDTTATWQISSAAYDNTTSRFSPNARYYLWGAQVELGGLTSYIPTISATASRARDIITAPTTSTPFSATEGSLYVDFKYLGATADQTTVVELDNTTQSERIGIYTYISTVRNFVVDGSLLVDDSIGSFTAKIQQRAAIGWKVNDFGGSLNGNTVVWDNTGTIPTPTYFRFSADASPATYNHKINRFVYVPRKVGNTEMPYWRYDGYCPEAAAFFARLPLQPSTERKVLYNNLIKKLVADGVWAKLDLFYILAVEHPTHGMTNLIQAAYTGTVTGDPRWIRDRCGQNLRLHTHFDPETAQSPNYTMNDASAFCWYLHSNPSYTGIWDPTYPLFLGPGGGNARINGASSGYNMTFTSTGAGMYTMSRTTSTNVNLYKNGTADAASPWTTSAADYLPDNIYVAWAGTSQTAMAGCGSNLSATDVANLYNAVRAYLLAIGALRI